MFFKDEKERRKILPIVDEEPSFSQFLNYKFIKPYIKDKKVLDIGCWTGQIEKLAVKDTGTIIGIDPGRYAIEFAKKNVPKAHFLVGTINSIPFDDSSFDVVLLLEVLEHIPKDTELSGLQEINRILKKDGFLLLTAPNNNFFSILLDPAFFLIGHRHYSYDRLREFLKKSGFEITGFSVRGGFTQVLFNNLSLLVKHILNRKLKETDWVKKNIKKDYRPGGFLTNCIIARKVK